MTGKSLRIYLADGTNAGVRLAEVVNWTGQALACPRSRASDLKEWDEVQRAGVYFLFGRGDENELRAYVGEAENVLVRLPSHMKREFWNQVVVLTSKDDYLTKAHVKYLESRFVRIANEVGRYVLENGNVPSAPQLPRGDRDAMEEFISNARLVLGALGHPILERIAHSVEPASDVETWSMSVKGIEARAVRTEEGFVVLAGSRASTREINANDASIAEARSELLADGTLALDGDTYRFTRDCLVSSSSRAASLVSGSARNGRICWKNHHGRTIKDVEEAV